MTRRPRGSALTPLGVVVLALLREGDMHPYEMMRTLRLRRRDRLVPITNGTFYHTVSRLERRGLLVEVSVGRDGNRPERTTYAVTDAGRDLVADWVRAELARIDRPAEFRVALAEAHNLDSDEVRGLLAERRRMLAVERDAYRDGLDGADARGVPEQFLVESARQLTLLDADLAWTDRLLARIADGDLPWGVDQLDPAHLERLHLLTREAIR